MGFFIPINVLLLLLEAIFGIVVVYFLIEWTGSWIRGRNLLISVLPKKEILVPVSGRNFSVVIYNKNKFDVECEVELEFPKEILYVYERNKMQFDEEYLSEIELDREYKEKVRVESMNKTKIELRLSPKQQWAEDYIYYSIKSEIKIVEGKINVRI